jgi:O-antigen/teichoic acid export membrane protein
MAHRYGIYSISPCGGMNLSSSLSSLLMVLPRPLSILKSSRFATNVLVTLGNRIMVMALGLITSVAVARYLGPEGRGLFAVAALITGLGVQFGNLGLHASNTYEVAKYPDRLSVLLGNSLAAGLGFGTILVMVAISVQWIYPQIVSIRGILWWLAIAGIPIGIVYLLLQNLLLGLHMVNAFNLVELVGKLATAILIVVALCVELRTPEWMAAATLMAALVSSLWCFTLLKAVVDKVRFSLSQFNSSIGFGAKAYFAALFAFLQQRIALLLIQQDFGATEAGFFSVAMTLLDLALIIPVTVGTILFPKLSAMQDSQARWELTFKVFCYVGIGMTVISIIAYLMCGLFIQMLFGETFLPAEQYFHRLLPGLVFLSMSSILMNYLGSSGMPIIVVYAPLLALLAMIAIYYGGVIQLGAQCAAIATSTGHSMTLIIIAIFVYCKKK